MSEEGEIERLRNELEEKKREIARLNKNIEELLFDDNKKSQKDDIILSLAKKNRNLKVSVNKERGKVAELTTRIKVLEESKVSDDYKHFVKGKGSLSKTSSKSGTLNNTEEDEILFQQYKKKYELSMKKRQFLRNEVDVLKSEIKNLKKILRDEIGDDWEENPKKSSRGRAKHILILQTRIVALKKTIQQMKAKASSDGTKEPEKPKKDIVQKKIDTKLKDYAQKRIKEITDLKKSVTTLTSKFKKANLEKNASKSRIEILERSCSDYKMKVDRLLQKTTNDDKLITMLKAEKHRVQKLYSKLKSSLGGTKKAEVLSKMVEQNEHSTSNTSSSGLHKKLKQKDQTIKKLRIKVTKLTKKKLQEVSRKHGRGGKSKNSNEDAGATEKLKLQLEVAQLENAKITQLNKELQSQILTADENFTKELLKARKKFRITKESSKQPSEEEESNLDEKIQYVEEENQVLQLTLETLKSSKQNEIAAYQKIISDTKKSIDDYAKRNSLLKVEVRVEEYDKMKSELMMVLDENEILKEENIDLKKRLNEISAKPTVDSQK